MGLLYVLSILLITKVLTFAPQHSPHRSLLLHHQQQYTRENESQTVDDCTEIPLSTKRRIFLSRPITLTSAMIFTNNKHSIVAATEQNKSSKSFQSGATGLEEYTNSITASRDTNVSPKEVYDTIQSRCVSEPLAALSSSSSPEMTIIPRALDMGAGAGVSTQLLWDSGYRSIDAVDWSGDAWRRFVVGENEIGQSPKVQEEDLVRFYEMDDERFVDVWRGKGLEPYDVIVFNFAVNYDKAEKFARGFLRRGDDFNSRLLAPVNVQKDYWMKQMFVVMDADGKVLWSTSDVGAWTVQFQPDVTEDTCQGVWCAPFNGFQKKK